FFFREKRNKKTRPLPPQQRGFCSRARLKISKGQVVFFEKITKKISTFKPLPIFILSFLFSLPEARLHKNKILFVFRFSSVTDKTTQKIKRYKRALSYLLFNNRARLQYKFNGRSSCSYLSELVL